MRKLTFETFLRRAKNTHGDKYDYSNVNFVDSKIKICILCLKHGEFIQSPYAHVRGQGCLRCATEITILKNSLDFNEFLERAKNAHGNKYEYDECSFINSLKNMNIICQFHGIFEQKPSHHIRGSGCPTCAKEKTKNNLYYNESMSMSEFLQKAAEVHDNKYSYENVVKFKSKHSQILIICPKHGEFSQSVNNHLRGCGCSMCGSEKTRQYLTKTIEDFICEANKIHNNFYDYSNSIYLGKNNPIEIICPIHGSFFQRPSNHLKGNGCPICGRGISKMCSRWLDECGVPIECREITITLPNRKKYRVDAFYSNVVYEFNGDFWHGNPKVYGCDEINPVNKKVLDIYI